MAITKSIEFFAPSIANSFNTKDNTLFGVNGLLSGAEITVQTATTVDVAAYAFVQNGLIVHKDDTTTGIVVPDFSVFTGPVHIVLSSPDTTNASGVTVSVVQNNAGITTTSVVVASRHNNRWSNPPGLDISSLREHALQTRSDIASGVIRDAGAKYGTTFGTPQGVRVLPGVASESDGARRILDSDSSISVATGPAAHVELDVANVDPDFDRIDHIVLRKTNDDRISSLDYVKGETLAPGDAAPTPPPTATVTVDTTAGNTNPCVDDNAAGEHIVVWANASTLYLDRRAHTSARASVSTDTQAMGATTTDVYITSHPRIASGNRLFGLASVGAATTEEIVLWRTDADGTGIDATTVTLTSVANSALNGHMVIDENNFAHIVFQHDESGGGVNNQVYYAKYNLADASWNTGPAVAVAPRFARGSNSGQNDTDPRIGIDNDGNLHIAFVRATSPAVVGDVIHLVIDQTGATVEAENTINTSISDGAGSSVARSNHAKPRVAITPQGDVYVAYLAEFSSGKPYLTLFETTLLARTGFKSVEVQQIATISAVNEVDAFEAFTDDVGRLSVFVLLEDVTLTTGFFQYFKFDPVIMSNGVQIAPDIITQDSTGVVTPTITGAGYGYAADSVYALHDRDGSLHAVSLLSNSVVHHKWSSQPIVGSSSIYEGKKHPQDTYLTTFAHTSGVANVLTPSGLNQLNRRRPAEKSPFTAVGNDGDYAGYLGLQQAINSLKGKGGKVIVRGGYYRLTSNIFIWSGIEILGEGNVIFDVTGASMSGSAFQAAGEANITIATTTAAQNQFNLSIDPVALGMRPGDLMYLYDDSGTKPAFPGTNYSGPYVVTEVIDSSGEIFLNTDVSGVISGFTTPRAVWYSTGVRIENATILVGTTSLTYAVSLIHLYKSELRDVVIQMSTGTATVLQKGCNSTRYDGCEIDASTIALDLDGSAEVLDTGTIISDCRFLDSVSIGATYGFHRIKVSGSDCEDTWTFANVTDVPVWTNNGGTISVAAFDSVATWADSAVAFANTLRLNQDTAAQAAGHISGNMIPTADDTELGSTTNRWKAFVNQVNLYGDIIPDTVDIRSVGGFSNHLLLAAARTLALNPNAAGAGLLGKTTDLPNLLKADNNYYANISTDSSGLGTIIVEGTGRIARPHRWFDDFLYHSTKWTTAATAPEHYTASATAPAQVNISSAEAGGAVSLAADSSAAPTSAVLQSQKWGIIDPSNDRYVSGFFRVKVAASTTNIILRIELRSDGTPNYGIGFEWIHAGPPALSWRPYVHESTTGYTYGAAILTPSTYGNMYCRPVSNTSVEFWASGAGIPTTVTFPVTFASINTRLWGLQCFIDDSVSGNPEVLIDAWEMIENLALSG